MNQTCSFEGQVVEIFISHYGNSGDEFTITREPFLWHGGCSLMINQHPTISAKVMRKQPHNDQLIERIEVLAEFSAYLSLPDVCPWEPMLALNRLAIERINTVLAAAKACTGYRYDEVVGAILKAAKSLLLNTEYSLSHPKFECLPYEAWSVGMQAYRALCGEIKISNDDVNRLQGKETNYAEIRRRYGNQAEWADGFKPENASVMEVLARYNLADTHIPHEVLELCNQVKAKTGIDLGRPAAAGTLQTA